jgi:D-inositol-3-phosphate glycosyltransferase
MCNIAVVSVHTSPLSRPGTRDSGGMNVYIRELSRQMGRRAHTMDIFTRRVDADTPTVTQLDERTRVIQVDAGPLGAEKGDIRRYLPDFTDAIFEFQESDGREYDLVHSHYWLSGFVGEALSKNWQTPHVVMFHTLGEAKNRHHVAEQEPAYRIRGEREVVAEADRIIACTGRRRSA